MNHVVRVGPDAGLVLPPIESFGFVELGAFLPHIEDGFTRKHFCGLDGIDAWRKRFGNRGVFRTVLRSNCPDLAQYIEDPETLWYGDLCFDFDVGKRDNVPAKWQQLILEVEQRFIPAVRRDWGIPDTDIRVWFSGNRGLHIEIPAASIGAWADPQLHRIYAHYAMKLVKAEGLEFLDGSLYGERHLYRLEHSVHQKTGLFKYPLKAAELPAIRDYKIATAIGARPRAVSPGFFTTTNPTPKTLSFYDTIVGATLEEAKVRAEVELPADNSKYDRSRALCVAKMFSPGYLHSEGSRRNLTFFLACHLKQNGFSYEQAEVEIESWAKDHCDPPYTSKHDRAEWMSILEDLYQNPDSGMRAGCATLQRIAPHLCEEDKCPIGQARLKRSQAL